MLILIVSPDHSGQGELFSSVQLIILIIVINTNHCFQCWSSSPVLYLKVILVGGSYTYHAIQQSLSW